MSFQADLFSKLKTTSSITNIVGSEIHFGMAPPGTPQPFLVFEVIATGGTTAHDGTRPVEFPTVQLSAWAKEAADAIELASALNAALDGKTIDGDSNLSLVFSSRSGQYDDEAKLFGEMLDFSGHTNTN